MHRNAELPSTRGQSFRNARAADGDEAQALRRANFSRLELRDESGQQLRDEHGGGRLHGLECREQVGRPAGPDIFGDR